MTRIAPLILACLVGCAHSNVGIHVGLGKNLITNQLGDRGKFERSASVFYIKRLGSLFARVEGGGWLAYGDGRKHSAYGCAGGGIWIHTPLGLYSRLGVSGGVISSPDSHLTSVGQFFLESAVGMTDGNWGLELRHLHASNGGIKGANIGIDLIGFGLVYYLGGK